MDRNPKVKYHLAIIGDGCSSFLLLESMSKFQNFKNLKILLIGSGEQLERTWCFWKDDVILPFSKMVEKSWTDISFHSDSFHTRQKLQKLKYHYLPGKAFFNYFHQSFLPLHPQVVYVKDRVAAIEKLNDRFVVHGTICSFHAEKVYNSAGIGPAPKIEIWQHFRGWFIETDKTQFDPREATLMHFGVSQERGCCFMYILPFSETKALVELTYFGPEPMEPTDYEADLAAFIDNNFSSDYKILNREYGKIPMQTGVFKLTGPLGEINLGTLAGMVKPSTGYAFQRMQQDSKILASAYFSGKEPKRKNDKNRFGFYDKILLWIILNHPECGKKIFTRLFKKRKIELILNFMEQKTNLWEEINIFSRLPIGIFLNALYHSYFGGSFSKKHTNAGPNN